MKKMIILVALAVAIPLVLGGGLLLARPEISDSIFHPELAGVRNITADANRSVSDDAKGVKKVLASPEYQNTCKEKTYGMIDPRCLLDQRMPVARHVASMQDVRDAVIAIAKREVRSTDAIAIKANQEGWSRAFKSVRAEPTLVIVEVVGQTVHGKGPLICSPGSTEECYGPEGMFMDQATFRNGIYKNKKTVLQVTDGGDDIPAAEPGNYGAVLARLLKENFWREPIQVGGVFASCGNGDAYLWNNRFHKIGHNGFHTQDWVDVQGEYRVSKIVGHPLAVAECATNRGRDFVPIPATN